MWPSSGRSLKKAIGKYRCVGPYTCRALYIDSCTTGMYCSNVNSGLVFKNIK
jgi:hypothetical protein